MLDLRICNLQATVVATLQVWCIWRFSIWSRPLLEECNDIVVRTFEIIPIEISAIFRTAWYKYHKPCSRAQNSLPPYFGIELIASMTSNFMTSLPLSSEFWRSAPKVATVLAWNNCRWIIHFIKCTEKLRIIMFLGHIIIFFTFYSVAPRCPTLWFWATLARFWFFCDSFSCLTISRTRVANFAAASL